MNRFVRLVRPVAATWHWLAQLRLGWRWIAKLALLGMVVLFTLYPHPVLLVRGVQHLGDVESLIQPELPEIAEMNRAITAQLKPDATKKEEFRAVERYVYEHIRYEYDWFNWGNLDYWPTAKEAIDRQREDCDGQAIVAASVLRARGFKTAQVVANLQHCWVVVAGSELMGPQPDKNMRRVGDRVVLTFPEWRTFLGSAAMLNKFPAVRSLVILAAALVLAYHPCRNLTGFLGVMALGLVGFVLLLDWSNRFNARANELEVGMLFWSLGCLLVALLGALCANRIHLGRARHSARAALVADSTGGRTEASAAARTE